MTLISNQLGALGEKIAAKYLKKKGYTILDVNFRYKRYGEIDIIAKKAENIVFIEVKTRTRGSDIYTPEDNITYFKKKQLIKLSRIYLAKKNLTDSPWQIDIMAIKVDSLKAFEIRHLEQAIEDIV